MKEQGIVWSKVWSLCTVIHPCVIMSAATPRRCLSRLCVLNARHQGRNRTQPALQAEMNHDAKCKSLLRIFPRHSAALCSLTEKAFLPLHRDSTRGTHSSSYASGLWMENGLVGSLYMAVCCICTLTRAHTVATNEIGFQTLFFTFKMMKLS